MANVGDRVLAEWPAEVDWWYPGVVVAAEGPRLVVQYDDGDRATLTDQQVVPLRIGEGSRVYGRWQAGRYYFPGSVTARTGEAIHIAYDDGDEEWTTVGLVRVRREDLPA